MSSLIIWVCALSYFLINYSSSFRHASLQGSLIRKKSWPNLMISIFFYLSVCLCVSSIISIFQFLLWICSVIKIPNQETTTKKLFWLLWSPNLMQFDEKKPLNDSDDDQNSKTTKLLHTEWPRMPNIINIIYHFGSS